jgi:hypothetical protein
MPCDYSRQRMIIKDPEFLAKVAEAARINREAGDWVAPSPFDEVRAKMFAPLDEARRMLGGGWRYADDVRITAVVIGAVIALSLLWGAGELHYRGCVDAATARTEARTASARREFERNFGALRGLSAAYLQREREKAIDGCSRLPF